MAQVARVPERRLHADATSRCSCSRRLCMRVGREIAIASAPPVGCIPIIGAARRTGERHANHDPVADQPGDGRPRRPVPVAALRRSAVVRHRRVTGSSARRAYALRSLLDYSVLLWMSRIRARPIALDMLTHLAFFARKPRRCERDRCPSRIRCARLPLQQAPGQASTRDGRFLRAPSCVRLRRGLLRELSERVRGRANVPAKARRDA